MSNRLSQTISDEQVNRIIQIESAGRPEAHAPVGSAAGLGQFLVGTWAAVGQKHYPDEVRRAGLDKWATMRVGKDTAALQLRILARFTEDNAKALGPGFTDGDLYLAHFLGIADARKVFKAPPDMRAALVVTPGAVKNNPSIIKPTTTCAQLRAWADASMRKRWDAAGRKDWVTIWWGPTLAPPPPDVEEAPKPAKPSPAAGKVAAGTAAAGAGAVVAASKAGLDWGLIAGIGFAFAVVAAAAFFIIRAARRQGG